MKHMLASLTMPQGELPEWPATGQGALLLLWLLLLLFCCWHMLQPWRSHATPQRSQEK